MTWTTIAGSCEQGPCPTVHVDAETGAVRVQGNTVTPHLAIPGPEGMPEIPAADWRNIVEQILAHYTP